MSDDALTASVMGEDAADLISTCGDDVAVPSAVIGSMGAPRNDLAYLDSSGTDGERSRRSSGSGSDEYTSHEDSPATANCSSGYPIERISQRGYWPRGSELEYVESRGGRLQSEAGDERQGLSNGWHGGQGNMA